MIRVASLFAQVLSLVSRREFRKAVCHRQAEKAAKGFSCWDQFVAMLFCQLGGANSLREICGGLATALGKLRHLGLAKAPARSTLSYANNHRPWELFGLFGTVTIFSDSSSAGGGDGSFCWPSRPSEPRERLATGLSAGRRG